MRLQIADFRLHFSAASARRVPAAVLLLLGLSLVVFAEFEARHWAKWREIIFQSESKSEYVLVSLDGKVFDSAQADLSDVRVVDEKGSEIGSKILVTSPELFPKQKKPVLLNSKLTSHEEINREQAGKPPTSSKKKESESEARVRALMNRLSGSASKLLIDLGSRNVPSVRIELEPESTNFRRRVVILGSNDDKDWQSVGDGEISDVRVGKVRKQQFSLDYNEARYRYLSLTIFNQDDQPLKFKEVRVFGWPRQLLFRREPGKSYRLFYGNAKAESPRYDLEQIAAYLKFDQLPTATPGDERNNENFVAQTEAKEKSLLEKQPAWLWATMGGVAMVLVALIYRLARMTTGEPTEQ